MCHVVGSNFVCMKVIGSNFTAPFSTILGIHTYTETMLAFCIHKYIHNLNQKLLFFERKTNITCKGFLKNANPWCHSIPFLQCIRFIYVVLDILFLSNHNAHKTFDVCFWAPNLLIESIWSPKKQMPQELL